jgi:hypothetical protein
MYVPNVTDCLIVARTLDMVLQRQEKAADRVASKRKHVCSLVEVEWKTLTIVTRE